MTLRKTAAVPALVVLLASGCGGSATRPESPAGRHVDLSWADGYGSLTELKSHADVVAFTHVAGVHAVGFVPESGNNQPGAPVVDLPFTDYTVIVDRVFKGSVQVGAALTVRQTGGPDKSGASIEVTDDPLLKAGERQVLFLHSWAPGNFSILGGPTGRLPVSESGAVSVLPGSALTEKPAGSLASLATALGTSSP